MNVEELKANLDLMDVNPKFYSLNGELNPDTVVLFQNYSKWEVFYVDEYGAKHNEKVFFSENDSCMYIYNLFKESKEIENKFGLNM